MTDTDTGTVRACFTAFTAGETGHPLRFRLREL